MGLMEGRDRRPKWLGELGARGLELAVWRMMGGPAMGGLGANVLPRILSYVVQLCRRRETPLCTVQVTQAIGLASTAEMKPSVRCARQRKYNAPCSAVRRALDAPGGWLAGPHVQLNTPELSMFFAFPGCRRPPCATLWQGWDVARSTPMSQQKEGRRRRGNM
jgi:hypothetical protein